MNSSSFLYNVSHFQCWFLIHFALWHDVCYLRPGRLDQHICLSLPSKHARKCVIEGLLEKTPVDDVCDKVKLVEYIVEYTHDYSIAELENIFREAAMSSLREDLSKTTVDEKHFLQSLQDVNNARVRPTKG